MPLPMTTPREEKEALPDCVGEFLGCIEAATMPQCRAFADGAILDWDHAPDDLRAAYRGGAILGAWNASFDSAVWNYSTLGFPFLAPEQVIDVVIQAGVSNLPTDLESASRYLGSEGTKVAMRVSAFLLLCVGVQIMLTGLSEFLRPIADQIK